ncbi:MAG TPA: ABC transporter substrate-binding protein, partial [Gammaproteobacteria bacterium]|nr:ABC transporter substrate-binding protein [Gammaproteobacteria bacterium]
MKNRLLKNLLAATLLLAGSHLVNAADDPIKIGTFLTVTGPASFLGDPELKTLQIVIEDLNAKGGLLGRKVELVHYDTGGNAKEAVNFVKRLIKSDNVDIIVGGTTTGDTMAVIPEVEKEGITLISLAGAVDIVEPVKKWVFK